MSIDPGEWGILPGYRAVDGSWIGASDVGARRALEVMGADSPSPPPTRTWVVTQDETVRLPEPAILRTEDNGATAVSGTLPPVPLGYHWLDFEDHRVRLIVSPGRAVLPPARSWGWAVQLYAARSRASWGIGDLADLGRLTRWAGGMGATAVLINPLHASKLGGRPEPSPYFPSSRRWRSPLYLRIEDVPGARALQSSLGPLAEAARALNRTRVIDRREVWRLKRAALAQIWAAGQTPVDGSPRGGAEFEEWLAERGSEVNGFAVFNVLSEDFGDDWRGWTAAFRTPGSPEVRAFADYADDRVRFMAWLQWLVERQLAAAGQAGRRLGVGVVEGDPGAGSAMASSCVVVGDLAVGVDPEGADAWEWQSSLALGVTAGAPPDDFNPDGQDWGVAPWDPWALRAAHYAPFIELVRAAFRSCGGLRVDHVAGLFRLFWVPPGHGPDQGVYVRYPWADLCNILALESVRAGAWVAGEDLGTVESDVRVALAERSMLGYRVLWFEDSNPAAWPEMALATATTHDLPTIPGLLSGADSEARQRAGAVVDAEFESRARRRLESLGVDRMMGGISTVTARVYGVLGSSPCRVVSASLDDALGVTERPNHPGTKDELPNWSLALPLPLEEVEKAEAVSKVAVGLNAARTSVPE